jgi:predicted PhzF superfamily epimerase YddE/YHI9
MIRAFAVCAALAICIPAPARAWRHAKVEVARAAASLGLTAEDVRTDVHVPQVVSVGLPFLVVELASREALRRARPDRRAYDALFPLDGARSVSEKMARPLTATCTRACSRGVW